MTDLPVLSFIIPVYNVQDYISQCIDSLINQTFHHIEIICVDDCSTDSSFAILQEYARKDTRVKVFKLEVNSRQGAARNYGIKVATGRYLSFIDSDDWVDITFAEDMVNCIQETGADYVRGGAILYSHNGQVEDSLHTNAMSICSDRENLNRYILTNGQHMWGGGNFS